MRTKTYLWTYLFILIGGILLIIFHSRANIFEGIIYIIATLFVIPSLISLFNVCHLSKSQKESGVRRPWILLIPTVGALIFGILLFSMPGFFTKYLIYTFGVIMLICGIIQIFFITVGIRLSNSDYWILSIPVLTFACGVAIIVAGPERVSSFVTIFTGIVLTIYSLNGFIGYLLRESRLRQQHLLAPSNSAGESVRIQQSTISESSEITEDIRDDANLNKEELCSGLSPDTAMYQEESPGNTGHHTS